MMFGTRGGDRVSGSLIACIRLCGQTSPVSWIAIIQIKLESRDAHKLHIKGTALGREWYCEGWDRCSDTKAKAFPSPLLFLAKNLTTSAPSERLFSPANDTAVCRHTAVIAVFSKKGVSLIGCMKRKRKQLSNDLSVRKSDSDHWKASPVLIRPELGWCMATAGGSGSRPGVKYVE